MKDKLQLYDGKYVILIVCLCLLGCSKDNCPDQKPPYVYDFHWSLRVLVPYTGNEILTFVNDSNDTIYLNGNGMIKSYITVTEPGTPGCNNTDITKYEVNDFEWKDTMRNYKIGINHSCKSHLITFSIQALKFQINEGQVGNANVSTYRETYTIGNKTYHNVNIISNDTNPSLQLIYNEKNGIILFNTSSTKVWKLM